MKQLIVKADETAIKAKTEKLVLNIEQERDWFRAQVI